MQRLLISVISNILLTITVDFKVARNSGIHFFVVRCLSWTTEIGLKLAALNSSEMNEVEMLIDSSLRISF